MLKACKVCASNPPYGLFTSAMDSVEALNGDNFATDFAWERFERVIDVGGSKGSKAIAILDNWGQRQIKCVFQ